MLAGACGSGEPGSTPDASASPDASAPDARADTGDPPAATRPPNPTCHPAAAAVPLGTAGLPARLSETGCFEAADPTRPLAALLPYTVNAPLWSDGADKDRWLALPDGGRIRVRTDGDLELPPGSALIKTFRLGARRVETRFFVRHAGGDWSGYTYEWNEAGTDAVLLSENGAERMIGDRSYRFPTRAECKQCHTDAAGGSLGLELGQLNGAGAGGKNQLQAWLDLDLFEGGLPAPPDRLPAFPRPADPAAPLEGRARAYLHANCAGCHRPEVDMSGSVDLRFATPLAATMSCDHRPVKGTQGFGAQVRILAPGNPDLSMIVLRMKLTGAGRMPEVGTLRVDDAGVALVSDWIRALAACP
jgi:uncharacterized repeat protein (TIGR03806 family)